jgi:hypothetical protein
MGLVCRLVSAGCFQSLAPCIERVGKIVVDLDPPQDRKFIGTAFELFEGFGNLRPGFGKSLIHGCFSNGPPERLSLVGQLAGFPVLPLLEDAL